MSSEDDGAPDFGRGRDVEPSSRFAIHAGTGAGAGSGAAVVSTAVDVDSMRAKFEEWFAGWEHAHSDNKGVCAKQPRLTRPMH